MKNDTLVKCIHGVCFLFLGLLLVALLYYLFNTYFIFMFKVLRYPFALDYGEGVVLQQLLKIPGKEMYGDINHYPFIIFNYPPVYYFLVRFFEMFSPDLLVTGRLVSIFATIGIFVIIFLYILRVTRDRAFRLRFMIALIAALTLFTYYPFFFWSVSMRVDTLALMLSLLGVYIALCSINRPLLLYAAAFSFLLALFTKQTMVSAPIATFAVMFFLRPQLALRVMFMMVVVGALLFILLMHLTQGGFVLHIIKYNINPFVWSYGWWWITSQSSLQWCYLSIVVISLRMLWGEIWDGISDKWGLPEIRRYFLGDPFNVAVLVTIFHCFLATAMAFTCFKTGSNVNYFLELMSCWSILIGMLILVCFNRLKSQGSIWSRVKTSVFCGGIILILIYQVLDLTYKNYELSRYFFRVPVAESSHLVEMIRHEKKPVLSSDPMLVLRAGKEVLYEPFTFQELVDMRVWDQELILRLIKEHFFAFVVTNDSGQENWGEFKYFPYNYFFHDFILKYYPITIKGSYYELHYPVD